MKTNKGLVMRKIIILLLALIIFGCISEKDASALKNEEIAIPEEMDINEDGQIDFASYKFFTVEKEGIKTTRVVNVYVENDAIIEDFNEFTDVDLINMHDSLSEFTKNYESTDDECSTNLGLLAVSCPDQKTCANICSSNSAKCKKLVEGSPEAIGHSVFLYARDNNEIRSALRDLNKELPTINDATQNQKIDFLKNGEKIVTKLASVGANPIYKQFELCEYGDYQAAKLISVTKKLATYSVQPKKFNYRITIGVELPAKKTGEKLSFNDLIAKDGLPTSLGVTENSISSPQEITLSAVASKIQVQWPAFRSSNERFVLLYEFATTAPPNQVLTQLISPTITLKVLNIEFLQLTLSLYGMLYSATKNFYISFASAFAITVIVILLLFNIIVILYKIIRAKMAKETASQGIFMALRKTRIKWKSDIVASVVSFIVGFAAMSMFAKDVKTQLNLTETIDFMISEPAGFLAVAGIFFGIVFLYSTIENRIKIYALEQRYGRKFKDEKALFIASGNELKTKIDELKKLVATLSSENFEVGAEHDFASSISSQRIDEIMKKTDPQHKREVEDYLTKVDEALSRLHELKKLSEQNWTVWNDYIAKLLGETDEVYLSGLVTIPASLRSWALNKFVKEHPDYGLTFEGELIRRREVSPDKIARAMIERKLLHGVVIVKDGKVSFSKCEGAGATIVGALTAKMLSYLSSAVKNVGQHDYNSVATIGDKLLLVLLKHHTMEALLIMEKEKFKEAIEEWKNKLKNV